MKACFSDFLKLRHGGTGYAFGPGPEAPFHSLSYPDINYTGVQARSPPQPLRDQRPRGPSPSLPARPRPSKLLESASGDTGVRPTRTFTGGTATIYPPALPRRRLFQIPDKDLGNASELGDTFSTGYAYTPERGS